MLAQRIFIFQMSKTSGPYQVGKTDGIEVIFLIFCGNKVIIQVISLESCPYSM